MSGTRRCCKDDILHPSWVFLLLPYLEDHNDQTLRFELGAAEVEAKGIAAAHNVWEEGNITLMVVAEGVAEPVLPRQILQV